MENPFVLIPYLSKSTFCDRKEELRIICDYIQNASNISLISPRRYGKTGLIYRFFDEINDLKLPLRTFYIDIYATQSLEDFIEKLTEGLADVLNKGSVLKKLLKSIGNIRPVLTYDTITHKAKLSFTFANEQEKKASIQSIFNFLEAQETRVLLAIDEFQQIREYITNSYNNTDGSYSMYIFDYNQQNVPGQVRASGKLYSVKIWTGNTLERYMIPYSDPATGEAGMYDLVYNVKYPSATGTNFVPGNVVSEKTVFEYTSQYSAGLLSRIMVGGGGGGVGIQNTNDNYQDFVGWGGGPSGCMTVGDGNWNSNKLWGASSQTSGYDFGVGGNAYDRTNGGWTASYGDHGAGGLSPR